MGVTPVYQGRGGDHNLRRIVSKKYRHQKLLLACAQGQFVPQFNLLLDGDCLLFPELNRNSTSDTALMETPSRGLGFRGPINYYRNFDHFFEVSQNLKEEKVSQPVLFIAGEKDQIIAGANAEQLTAMLSGGTKDLRGVKLIPNVSHWAGQEAVEKTNSAIIEFIKGLD
jgi:pimeloyl-ACP methyl ester carboxylesterase